eukprot:TRINITY_DN10168_c0_g2_i1.p1 TRINITY_DN10168_c0_g2~~TRINITY_DN10168_c0_g2_i1.p1  ORF type:complete len:874 (+),score=115.46 TRINITY_DN10168_c0_g2_i1:50-2671(+)
MGTCFSISSAQILQKLERCFEADDSNEMVSLIDKHKERWPDLEKKARHYLDSIVKNKAVKCYAVVLDRYSWCDTSLRSLAAHRAVEAKNIECLRVALDELRNFSFKEDSFGSLLAAVVDKCSSSDPAPANLIRAFHPWMKEIVKEWHNELESNKKYGPYHGYLWAGRWDEFLCKAVARSDVTSVQALIEGGAAVTGQAFITCAFETQSGFGIRDRLFAVLMEQLARDPNSYKTFGNMHQEAGLNKFVIGDNGRLYPLHAAVMCRGDRDISHLVLPLLEANADPRKFAETSKTYKLPLQVAVANEFCKLEAIEALAKAYPEGMMERERWYMVDPNWSKPIMHQGQTTLSFMHPQKREAIAATLSQVLVSLGSDFVASSNQSDNADDESRAAGSAAFNLGKLVQGLAAHSDGNVDSEFGEMSKKVGTLMFQGMLQQLQNRSESGGKTATDFSVESKAFADANPQASLGRETHAWTSADFFSCLHAMGFSENVVQEMQVVSDLLLMRGANSSDLQKLENAMSQLLLPRLSWAGGLLPSSSGCDEDSEACQALRFAVYLISCSFAHEGIHDLPEVTATKTDSERLQCAHDAMFRSICDEPAVSQIMSTYSERLKLPASWDLSGLLRAERARAGFSGGELVFAQSLPSTSPEYSWVQQLLSGTFLGKYTRDRGKAKVPTKLKLRGLVRVFNCKNWSQYVKRREEVLGDVTEMDSSTFWSEPLRTDAFSDAAGAPQDLSALEKCNEHWLWHGTSSKGAASITEGDFRISMAGSAAGTLYGRGIYLAESSSKSDEYTKEDEGEDGLRTLLLCRACLGRVNYTDAVTVDDREALESSCAKGNGYHSVLGDREKCRGTYREIIVYDNDQVYPAYIVHYSREY